MVVIHCALTKGLGVLQLRHPELVPWRKGGIIWILSYALLTVDCRSPLRCLGKGVKEPGGLRYPPHILLLIVFICVAASKQQCPLLAGGMEICLLRVLAGTIPCLLLCQSQQKWEKPL